MKVIKDPVHGYIEVEPLTARLLDSRSMQRLRHIKQLGFSYLVYPGANHSRFEHSLGTKHLAGIMSRHLGLNEESRNLIVVTALLHDSGHGPFSHATEPFMKEIAGRGHEQIEHLIQDDPIAGILEEHNLNPPEINRVLKGEHTLSSIIHGDLDVDRMDYLLRDAHYTGVPYGTVDAQRLIQNTLLSDQGLILDESGINAAESLLIARTLMRPAVYIHHVTRIATSMLQRALLGLCEGKGPSTIEKYLQMDDASLMHEMLHSEDSVVAMLAERLYGRQLYKRVIYAGPDVVNSAALQGAVATIKGQRALAEEIAEGAGVEEWEVLVDIPPQPPDLHMEVLVRNRHTVIHLAEISPLVNALNETRKAQWRVGVYAPAEVRKQVERTAIDVLHVKRATKQDRLTIES